MMDPKSGDYLSLEEWRTLSPVNAERFTVQVSGTEDEIRHVSSALKEASRRRNKAARKARRKGRQ